MIYIEKKPEPKSLTKYKLQEHAYYDGCPKNDIRESLFKEQGHLCAYCMRRIEEAELVRIEHWKPESLLTEYEKLDYKNMLGVCLGHIEGTQGKDDTCDAHKGNTPITVNPLDEITLRSIYYDTKNGEIHSSNTKIDNDLDVVLNLNSLKHRLPNNRKTKLDEFLRLLTDKFGKKDWTVSRLSKVLERYSALNEDGSKVEYLGIVSWYLNKRINSAKSNQSK